MTIKDINKNQRYSICCNDECAWLEWYYFNEQVLDEIKDIPIIKANEVHKGRPNYFVSKDDYAKILKLVWN